MAYIETPAAFEAAIAEHVTRMVTGEQKRFDAGEMPKHERCICGDIILSSLMEIHLENGANHTCGVYGYDNSIYSEEA